MKRLRAYREDLEVQAGVEPDSYAPKPIGAPTTPPEDEDATEGLQNTPAGEVVPVTDDLELDERIALRVKGQMARYESLTPEGRIELLYELKIRSVAEEALSV